MNANENLENTVLPNESNDVNNQNVTPAIDVEQNEIKHDSNLESIDNSNDEETPAEIASEESVDEVTVEAEESTVVAETEETETTPPVEIAETEEDSKSGEVAAETSDIVDESNKTGVAADNASTDELETEESIEGESEVALNDKSKEIVTLTFEEIVEKLRELSKKEKFSRKDLDKVQYLFLNESRKEIEAQKQQFIKDGGEAESFIEKDSALHSEGKSLLLILAEKRKLIAADEEKLKEKNLERKLAMIERVKELTESQDDFSKTYQEFKSLQQEWNNIRLVPHGKEHELWKSFQQQVEKFYDIVRIHNEFRDYDFKKNLEIKAGLCESAEKLIEEEDTVSAFHQLQKLHKDWRDVGPVARKDREPIWQRFKEVSAEINKKYQSHIESLKEKEGENYEKKVAISEELEAIDYTVLKNTRDWDAKMREVLNLQEKWREVGYAPRKVNAKIFKRYRTACDLFFKNKNAYYQTIRGELDENLLKKIALCERAEELKESTDWRKTTPEFMNIQREWKEIGMVPRRNSSSIWKRFIGACDYFFEQKKKHTDSLFEAEVENLNLKRAITEKIKTLDTSLSNEEALELLKDLMAEWQAVGFVPFNEKNKAYKEFTEVVDAQFSRMNLDKSERKLETFKSNITDMTKSDHSRGQVFYEREKLMRQYEKMKSELQTYENNIGFLTSSSKKGNSLVDVMINKIEKIKEELDLIVKKIDAIDENI